MKSAIKIWPVRFVGAGVGRAGLCSYEGVEFLKECEVCLYDSLLDEALLDHLSPTATKIYVGKRCNAHSFPQKEISQKISELALEGRKVVRLKGGDPTVFGRISEEIDSLEQFNIPFTITPAVSSYQCAAIDAGILLTKRGVSHGFTIMTARDDRGEMTNLDGISAFHLPIIFYMGTKIVDQICQRLKEIGIAGETSVQIIYNAGSESPVIESGTVDSYSDGLTPNNQCKRPGVIIIGASKECFFTQIEGKYV